LRFSFSIADPGPIKLKSRSVYERRFTMLSKFFFVKEKMAQTSLLGNIVA